MTASQTPEAAKPLYDRNGYTKDPEGLARMREVLLQTRDWHDRASINCNSLARLLDTIDILSRRAPVSGEAVAPFLKAYDALRGFSDGIEVRCDASFPLQDAIGRARGAVCVHSPINLTVGDFRRLAAHPKPAGEGVEALREKIEDDVLSACSEYADMVKAYTGQRKAVHTGYILKNASQRILSTLSGGLGSRPAAQAVPTERTSP